MVMKISNYEGTADTFTFPHNPKVFDNPLESNHTVTNIAYRRHHILVSAGGIAPKLVVLQGYFDDQTSVNKRTDYRTLARHFSETTKLKKLYWETDKFFLGTGQNCKENNQGGRTAYIDYVASFICAIGILFGNTQRTSGTNEGNVTTFVEEITGTVTNGAVDITVSDALGNAYKIPASALTTGQAIVIKFITMVDSGNGINVTEYNYLTIAGTESEELIVTSGLGLAQIAAGANVSTITTTNLTSAVVKFRDGWSA